MTVSTPQRDPASGIPPALGERALAAARDGRSALRLLRERQWVYAMIGVIFLSIVFVFLGRWQFGRHLARSAKNDQVTSNYTATPAPLESVLPAAGAGEPGSAVTVPLALQWRPVQVSGEYLVAQTVLIRNRPYSTGANDSSNGYEVVVPLRLTSGVVILINRGWIPTSGTNALKPDSVPAAPSGTVEVVARLRPSEPASSRSAPPGQAVRLNAPALAKTFPPDVSAQVVNGFAVLDSETPAAADTPSDIEPPDPGIGINLAYAVQWWLFAIVAYVLFAIAGIKEIRRREA